MDNWSRVIKSWTHKQVSWPKLFFTRPIHLTIFKSIITKLFTLSGYFMTFYKLGSVYRRKFVQALCVWGGGWAHECVHGVCSLVYVNGTQMGPLLVLVCPCFRENVIVTCKIVSFLCSWDNFLLKNVIVFFLSIKFQNGAHLKKRLFLTYFSQFLVTRGKTQKFIQHISHLHTYTYFAHPIDFLSFLFFLTNFAKIKNLSCMVYLWCDSWG